MAIDLADNEQNEPAGRDDRAREIRHTSASPHSVPRSLDLNALTALLKSRWKLFVAVAVLVTALTIGITFVVTPSYTSQLSIYFDPNKRSDPNAAEPGTPPDQSFVETEIGKLIARPVLEGVVDRAHLASDPEFGRYLAGKTASEPPRDPALQAALDREEAIKRLNDSFTIKRDGTSYIATLSVKSESPVKAQKIASSFPEAYVAVREEQQAQALDTLNRQVRQLGDEVREADAEVARYRTSKGLVRAGAAAGTITDQEIASMADRVAAADSELAAAISRANAARAQIAASNAEDVVEAAKSPVIGQFRAQRADIVREQARIAGTYGPLHPESKRIRDQLAEIDAQIKAEALRIETGLRGDVAAAHSRWSALRTELDRLRSQQSINARNGVEEDRLERNADAKRLVYAPLAQASQRIAQQLQVMPATVIAPATLPVKPTFPNKPLIGALGGLLGLLLGFAAIFIADSGDRGIRDPSRVESSLGLPLLASIPKVSARALRAAAAERPWDMPVKRPDSAYTESLRNIRSVLATTGSSAIGEVICVTSALPIEGKSTLAVSLARVMAMSGDRTILLDTDLRRTSLASLTSGRKFGLSEVLQRSATLQQTLVPDVVEHLHLLPQSGTPGISKDLLGSDGMKTLLRTLRGHYRFIVLDAPPVLAMADARALAHVSDRTLLAVRWGVTPGPAVRVAIKQLQMTGAHIAGIVLTQVDISARTKLGEDSPYYYYKSFSSYYAN